MEKIKIIWFRFLAIVLSLIFCIFISELFICLFLPDYFWKYWDASMDWQLDEKLGWVQKPNLDVTTRTAKDQLVRFRTNQDGLIPATAEREKNSDKIRIMVFGDSTVVGRAVPQDKSVTAQMEQRLCSIGIPAEVINAGVEAYSTDQVFIRIQQLVPLYNPDIVVYGFCTNDLWGNLIRNDFGRYKPVFVINENGTLEEIPPDIKKSEIRVFSSGVKRLLKSSAVYRFFLPKARVLMSKFITWELQNYIGLTQGYYYKPEELKRINWSLFTALLKQMEEFSRKCGAKYFFYPHPELVEVWDPCIQLIEKRRGLKPGEYDRRAIENCLKEIAKDTSVDFCPVIDYFIANKSRGPFHLLPRDPHCNPDGYELLAEVISQFLIESGFITLNDNFKIR